MIDSSIIRRAIAQDRAAQELIYSSFERQWFAICLRYNPSRDDALDALQNALINIFSNLRKFDSKKGQFKSWSNKIVVNENLMLLRKKVASFKVDELKDDLVVVSDNEDPDDMLSAKELTRMIQQLPEGYRTVFNLYVIEGFGHKEIGEMLKISEGTSKSQLFKAKKLLKQKLAVLI